jgi:tetratricopeptide (TPR) repeat protein
MKAPELLVGLLTFVLVACHAVEPLPPGYTDHSNPFSETVPLPHVSARDQLLADPELAPFDDALMAGMSEQPDTFLDDVPDRILVPTERLLLQLGRFTEMFDYYRRRVEQDGPDSRSAPRLAYHYALLGYYSESRRLVTAALEADPENPDSHFALAALLQRESTDRGTARRDVAEQLLHVERLDPRYAGFDGVSTDTIEKTLRALPTETLDAFRHRFIARAQLRVAAAVAVARNREQ